MTFLLFASVIFVAWSVFIIRLYYSGQYGGPNHLETFLPQGVTGPDLALYTSPLISYFVALIAVYAGYKLWTIWMSPREKIQFGFGKIVGFFLIHLAILCITFFSIPESGATRGFFPLFLGIIQYLLYPALLILLTRTAGLTILSRVLPGWKNEDIRMRLGVETSLGFALFVTLLIIVGLLGLYNLVSLIIIGIVFVILSYPSYKDTWSLLSGTYFEVENHKDAGLLKLVHPYLLSGEFLFIVLTFIMGVSFISIYRPMPIGWDDLGVYMNFPKIIALNETLLQGGGYTAWQLITGTGFLLGKSATQAFFINQLGGILSIIMLLLSLSFFFTNPKKKYFIALPILLTTLWYALPMIVFQQAKDMKLDPALFFFTISAITALVGYWDKWVESKRSQRDTYFFLGIIGILVGFAFTVKLTTIMLIIASVAFISFRTLGFVGFIGYAFLFVGIFTKLHLWTMLGVVMPTDSSVVNSSSYTALVIGIILTGVATYFKNPESLKKYLLLTLSFTLGLVIPLVPWTVKSVIEIGDINKATIGSLIGGSGGIFVPDYSKIYSETELKNITDKTVAQQMTGSGQSQNEDMGRYFGYETGLNNYLKLPANLTFQVNQSGEFTDITYVFLALFPVLFLFLRGRNQFVYLTISSFVLSFFFLYYFYKIFYIPRLGETQVFLYTIGESISAIFSTIQLPLGYVYIFAGFLLSITGLYFLLEKNDQNKKITDISIFLSLYSFIFVIAAFGIVWYGIAIYFCLLLLIGLMSLSFVEYDDSEEASESDSFVLKGVLSVLMFGVIALYFTKSSYPHGWTNLKQSYYAEFKAGELTKEQAIFKYRADYLDPIAYMNLSKPEEAIKEAISLAKNPKLVELFSKQAITRPSDLYKLLTLLSTIKDAGIQAEVQNIGQSLYEKVLYPEQNTKNTQGIYRIGTFMTYFIDNNRKRYLEDSLIFTFNDYFYDTNPEKTVDRMKKLGLGFLLTDLNAATIDRDPRHNLTTRFENLLKTMPASNLELISTDSPCLHIAIDDARSGKLSGDDYIDIAGVNYESYRIVDGKEVVINRTQKKMKCYNYILGKMFTENAVNEKNYPYLLDIKNLIVRENAISDQQKLGDIMNSYIGQSWFALFKIKDNYTIDALSNTGTLVVPPITTTTGSGMSSGSTTTGL